MLRQTVRFPAPGHYRVLVDVYPNIPGGQPNFQLFRNVVVSGAYKPKPLPAFTADQTVDGYHIDMHSHPTLHAIQAQFINLTVRDAQGHNVTFVPWFGALAHAIFFHEGSLDYFHTHVCGVNAPNCTSVLGATRISGHATAPGKLTLGVLLPVPGNVAVVPPDETRRTGRHRPVHAPGQRMTRAGRVAAFAAVVLLLAPAAAWAHAEISPAVSLSGRLQLYSLAVPTEKSGAVTTKVELTLPSGFSIDSFVPAPGWQRQLQQTGSGENAVIQKVTWSGGHVPTGEDSAVPVPRHPGLEQDVHVHRPPDVLRRIDRQLVGTRVLGFAGSVDRSQEQPQWRRRIRADDRRADRRRARAARRRLRAARR